MSSTLSPITILEHTSHIHNKQHWQHVQYIQSNHYIRTYVPHTLHNKQHWQHDQYTQSNHCIRTYVPHTLQTTLTTCPVHSVQSLYYKICPTYRPYVQYVQSLYYIPPPTYETHSTDHMSSTYGPITILDPTIHLRNTHHWPHVQYVQSYHYSISHQPLTEHTSLTTCPVRTVLSLYYIPPPTYETHSTDHMSSTYSPITILDPTTTYETHSTDHMSSTYSPFTILDPTTTYGTHITDHMSSTYSPITIVYPTNQLRNTHHWPHVQYVQSFRYIISHHVCFVSG